MRKHTAQHTARRTPRNTPSRTALRKRGRWTLPTFAAAITLILAGAAPAMSAPSTTPPAPHKAAEGSWVGQPVILDGKDTDRKTERPRSAWKTAPAPQAKGAPLTPQQAANQALADARRSGPSAGLDTSKVPLGADGDVTRQAAALGLPPTNWGNEPPADDTKACLDRDGAGTSQGETYNRWLWCKKFRLGVEYFKIVDGKPEYQGTSSVAYHAVSLGNGQQRAVRTYFQAQYDSVEYDGWSLWDRYFTAPDLSMYVLSDCTQSSDFCFGSGSGVEHTWDQWDYHREWLHWDIYSREEASKATDKVLFHQWHFRFGGSGDGYTGPEGTTANRTIRCDSANYFSQFGVDYPKACVNYDVVPHLQYSISDKRVASVAQHIRFAQDNPTKTYPIEFDTKKIPGKYSGSRDDKALHRIADNDPTAKANEDTKNAACNRQPPYTDWRGLPPYDTKTKDCDEYPFQSTEEGAASWDWDFSVRAVPNGENRAAGGLLRWYYFSDRVLYGTDAFWVEIND